MRDLLLNAWLVLNGAALFFLLAAYRRHKRALEHHRELHDEIDERREWMNNALGLIVLIAHAPVPVAASDITEQARALVPEDLQVNMVKISTGDDDEPTLSVTKRKGETRH